MHKNVSGLLIYPLCIFKSFGYIYVWHLYVPLLIKRIVEGKDTIYVQDDFPLKISSTPATVLELLVLLKFKIFRHSIILKLVSHWHANFSRLLCEFCRRLLHNIRASVARVS